MAANRGARDEDFGYQKVTTPSPDPTQRTIEASQREISRIEQLFNSKFDGYDKAIKLLQDAANKSPSIDVVDERIKAVEKVFAEKFKGIETQFIERDTRTAQTLTQGQTALIAALAAAKEIVEKQNASSALAIAKNETTTAEQIKQMVLTFGETTKGLVERIDGAVRAMDGKIDAVKDRLVAIERGGYGQVARVEGRQDTWSSIGATIVAVGAAIAAVIAVIAYVMK